MILPTKRLSSQRSLIGIGAQILALLNEPKTVSRLWQELSKLQKSNFKYDWFILGIDTLYLVGAIQYEGGKVIKNKDDTQHI